jgi:RNA 2',3'-cyclic 3'-phosphodiesterase
MSGKTIRAFVAVHISPEAKGDIADFAERIFGDTPGVKAVETENLHLTLKFLGEIGMDETAAICDTLKSACAGVGPFTMSLKGVGAFPNARRPRVVWVGIEEPSGKLRELNRRIEASLTALGYRKEEHESSPHLTIGRVKFQDGGSRLAEMLEKEKDADFGEEDVDAIYLMMSELSRSGPKYTIIGTIKLE